MMKSEEEIKDRFRELVELYDAASRESENHEIGSEAYIRADHNMDLIYAARESLYWALGKRD